MKVGVQPRTPKYLNPALVEIEHDNIFAAGFWVKFIRFNHNIIYTVTNIMYRYHYRQQYNIISICLRISKGSIDESTSQRYVGDASSIQPRQQCHVCGQISTSQIEQIVLEQARSFQLYEKVLNSSAHLSLPPVGSPLCHFVHVMDDTVSLLPSADFTLQINFEEPSFGSMRCPAVQNLPHPPRSAPENVQYVARHHALACRTRYCLIISFLSTYNASIVSKY